MSMLLLVIQTKLEQDPDFANKDRDVGTRFPNAELARLITNHVLLDIEEPVKEEPAVKKEPAAPCPPVVSSAKGDKCDRVPRVVLAVFELLRARGAGEDLIARIVIARTRLVVCSLRNNAYSYRTPRAGGLASSRTQSAYQPAAYQRQNRRHLDRGAPQRCSAATLADMRAGTVVGAPNSAGPPAAVSTIGRPPAICTLVSAESRALY